MLEVFKLEDKTKLSFNQCVTQKQKTQKLPFVADIHFDYKLALQLIESGVDKVRINPGNFEKYKIGYKSCCNGLCG